LRIAQADRERKVQNSDDLSHDLNKKLAMLKDLEQEQFFS